MSKFALPAQKSVTPPDPALAPLEDLSREVLKQLRLQAPKGMLFHLDRDVPRSAEQYVLRAGVSFNVQGRPVQLTHADVTLQLCGDQITTDGQVVTSEDVSGAIITEVKAQLPDLLARLRRANLKPGMSPAQIAARLK